MKIILTLKMILWQATGKAQYYRTKGLEQKRETERKLQKLKKPEFVSAIKQQ